MLLRHAAGRYGVIGRIREFHLQPGVYLYCFPPRYRGGVSRWQVAVWVDALGLSTHQELTREQARLWLERAGLMNGITRRAA
jgi:hypothetical protein